MSLADALEFIQATKLENPAADKAAIQAAFMRQFSPAQRRSVFSSEDFAVRFCEATTGSFSNTVLSLSALKQYDDKPFVVCVVRPRAIDFLLANSTFIRKISHSSHTLTIHNVKGSFNGTDISSAYEGIVNHPTNFEELFAAHSAFSWDENLERLVNATTQIVGKKNRFEPSSGQRVAILQAPLRAEMALMSGGAFQGLEQNLLEKIDNNREAIFAAAEVENVNIRGNRIEQIITGGANAHDLGDMFAHDASHLIVADIKTKLKNRASAPKGYNIDKMLQFLSRDHSVFAFFIVEIDAPKQRIRARLVPVLEMNLLNFTTVQHHWAGRNSRGVTQLFGNFQAVLDENYSLTIDRAKAETFLNHLLDS